MGRGPEQGQRGKLEMREPRGKPQGKPDMRQARGGKPEGKGDVKKPRGDKTDAKIADLEAKIKVLEAKLSERDGRGEGRKRRD